MMVGHEVDSTYRHRFCASQGSRCELRDVHPITVCGCEPHCARGRDRGPGRLGQCRAQRARRAIFGADRIGAAGPRSGPVPPRRSVARGPGALSPAEWVWCRCGRDRRSRAVPPGTALLVPGPPITAGMHRLPALWASAAARVAADLIGRLRVVTPSMQRLTKFLSGGNQQKVVVGKWLAAGSRFFIFDEPTRGIDVGAKAEIFGLIEDLVAGGARR